MKNLIKNVLKSKTKLIVLKHTTRISEEMIEMPEWAVAKEMYSQLTNPEDRLVPSVFNSIFTQRRIVFCLVVRSAKELIQNDKNWSAKPGFDHNKWTQMIKVLIDSGLVKETRKGQGQQPSIYEVIDSDVLSLLNVDRNQQLAEAIEFADKFTTEHNTERKTERVPELVTERVTEQVDSSKYTVARQKAEASLDLDKPVEVAKPSLDVQTKRISFRKTEVVNKVNTSEATKTIPKESSPKVPLKGSPSPGSVNTILEQVKSVELSKLNAKDREFIESIPAKLEEWGSLTTGQQGYLSSLVSKFGVPPKKFGKEVLKAILTTEGLTAKEMHEQIMSYNPDPGVMEYREAGSRFPYSPKVALRIDAYISDPAAKLELIQLLGLKICSRLQASIDSEIVELNKSSKAI